MRPRSRSRTVLVSAVICSLAAVVPPVESHAASGPGPAHLRRAIQLHPASRSAGYDPRSILVRFAPGRSRLSALRAIRSAGLGTPSPIPGTGYFLVPAAGRPPRRAVAALTRAAGVAWAGLNYRYQAVGTGPRRTVPDDPLFPEQILDQLDFPLAWSITKGSGKDKIAIADTGVQADHPDLAGRVAPGHNCVSANKPPADDNGHGTMVAGAAAANTNNGLDIAGAAWKAQIQPVKVLNSKGIGTAAQVACGITWAAGHGASVINLSLAGPAPSPVLRSAVRYALSKNVVVVAASGNGFTEQPMYPAAYPEVLAVTAEGGTDWPIGFDWFSSHGWWVDLAAPGIDIQGTQLGGEVALGTGTSMAAPFVSGVALLVRAKHPGWPASRVAADLVRSARDAGPPGIDPYYGYGIVQPYAALGGAKTYPVPHLPDAYEPNDAMAQAKPITSAVSPTITPEGDVDWFYKNVTAPGSVTFTVTPLGYDFPGRIRSAEMRTHVQVFGPDRHLLADRLADFGSYVDTNQVTVEVPATSPGRYFIAVANAFGSVSWQSYTVTAGVSRATAPPAFDLPQTLYPSQVPVDYLQKVAAADITGDGRPDVVDIRADLQGTGSFLLDIHPQTPSGKLGPAITIQLPFGRLSSYDFAVADMNRDGRPDIAIATVKGVAIFLNKGRGVLKQGMLIPVPASDQFGAGTLAIADLNHDGRPDMIVRENDQSLYVVWNKPSGFQPVRIGSTEGGRDPQIGDVNGDGRPDIGFYLAQSVYLFEQQPGGSFAEKTITVSSDSSDWISGLAIGDVTGDSRDDVVVSVPGSIMPQGRLIVYPQTARGKLGAPVTYTANRYVGPITIADVNRDGRKDVLALGEGDVNGLMSMFMQQPDGSLRPALDLPFPVYKGVLYGGVFSSVPVLADMNGDHLPDLVTTFAAGYVGGIAIAHQPSGLAWVTKTAPVNLSTGVSRHPRLRASFGQPLARSSVTTSAVRLMNARNGTFVPIAVSYASSTHTIAIRPRETLQPHTPYVVFLSGAANTHGVRMPGAFTYRFVTGG